MVLRKGYYQFCPVSMGSEIFAERWTPLVIRELLMGSTRFNDLRKGMPRISQSMLSKRLHELEGAGLVQKEFHPEEKTHTYHLTEAGEELRPVVVGLGEWAYRWLQVEIKPENLDPALLMWDMHRRINEEELPAQRVVISFFFPDAKPGNKRYWLVLEPRGIDLCFKHPGFEVDLSVEGDLLTMVRVWLGDVPFGEAVRDHRITLEGPKALAEQMHKWLALSSFAVGTRMKNLGMAL